MAGILAKDKNYFPEFVLSEVVKNIPKYQRPYRWGKEHIERFWEDINDSSDNDPLFIGTSIVLAEGNKEYEIIDGQQRLTTSVIFLIAIRNFGYYLSSYLEDKEKQYFIEDFINKIKFAKGNGQSFYFNQSKDLIEIFTLLLPNRVKNPETNENLAYEDLMEFVLDLKNSKKYSKEQDFLVLENHKLFIEYLFEGLKENNHYHNFALLRSIDQLEVLNPLIDNFFKKELSLTWNSSFTIIEKWLDLLILRPEEKEQIKDIEKKISKSIENQFESFGDSIERLNFLYKKVFNLKNEVVFKQNLLKFDSNKILKELNELTSENIIFISGLNEFLKEKIQAELNLVLLKKYSLYLKTEIKKVKDKFYLLTNYDSNFDDSIVELKKILDETSDQIEIEKEKITRTSKSIKEIIKNNRTTMVDLINKKLIDKTGSWNGAFDGNNFSRKDKIEDFVKQEKKKIQEEASNNLVAYFDALTSKYNSVQFVEIKLETDSESKALEIFETVNDAGVKLSVEDLLKNIIFKYTDTDQAQIYWTQIIENLSSTKISIAEFIRNFWASRYEYISSKKIFNSIKTRLGTQKENWDKLLEDLQRFSFIYDLILNRNEGVFVDYIENSVLDRKDKFTSDVYKNIFILRSVKSGLWTILYLTLIVNLKNILDNIQDTKKKSRLKKELGDFSFLTFIYYNIFGEPSNFYFSLMHSKSQEIWENLNSSNYEKNLSLLISLNNSLKQRINSKIENLDLNVTNYLMSLKYNEGANFDLKTLFYVIEKIDGKLSSDLVQFEKLTIEHIVPQKPVEWGMSETQVKPFIHTIGNLMLLELDKNQKRDNKSKVDSIPIWEGSFLPSVGVVVEKIKNDIWAFDKIEGNKNLGVDLRFNYLKDKLSAWIKEICDKEK